MEIYDNREIYTTAAKALNRHLWCLSEQLVSYAFFDVDIDFETKRKMLQALDHPESVSHPNRIDLEHHGKIISKLTLDDFVTIRNHIFIF